MWMRYRVALKFEGPFAASLPRTPDEIRAMLRHRMPVTAPPDATPMDELEEQVQSEVLDEDEDEWLPGWATFKRDEGGYPFYEGRCVRGHIKDCAQALAPLMKSRSQKTAFKAKVAQRVFVEEDRLSLMRDGERIGKLDGTEERFIQVMTRQGARSSIKHVDYIDSPEMYFTLRVLNDGMIGREDLGAILEYGSIHGMGQERSQGWGRYEVKELVEV